MKIVKNQSRLGLKCNMGQSACLAFLLALASCFAGLSSKLYAADVTIEFFNSAFLPQSVDIDPGDTVTWVRIAGTHSLTSGLPGGSMGTPDEPGALFQVTLDAANPSFSYTFPASPTGYNFFDALNPVQIGIINVSDGLETAIVTVLDNVFAPEDIYIFEGDTVRWVHEPMEMPHTVTSGLSSDPADMPGALFDEISSDSFPIFEYQFLNPGIQPYFCRPHEALSMNGRVLVQRLFIRGDASMDGSVDLGDPVTTLAYLFQAGSDECLDAHDINDDGTVDIGDAIYSLAFLFSAGSPPLFPFPLAGADRTADNLHCL